MIPVIGHIYRERNVVISVFGRTLVNRSVIQILKHHRRVRMIAGDLSVVDTYPILEIVKELDLGPCIIDIGRIAIDFREKGQGQDLRSFVEAAVKPGFDAEAHGQPTDVVLYGFGRIGRILARLLIEQAGLITDCP